MAEWWSKDKHRNTNLLETPQSHRSSHPERAIDNRWSCNSTVVTKCAPPVYWSPYVDSSNNDRTGWAKIGGHLHKGQHPENRNHCLLHVSSLLFNEEHTERFSSLARLISAPSSQPPGIGSQEATQFPGLGRWRNKSFQWDVTASSSMGQ